MKMMMRKMKNIKMMMMQAGMMAGILIQIESQTLNPKKIPCLIPPCDLANYISDLAIQLDTQPYLQMVQ